MNDLEREFCWRLFFEIFSRSGRPPDTRSELVSSSKRPCLWSVMWPELRKSRCGSDCGFDVAVVVDGSRSRRTSGRVFSGCVGRRMRSGESPRPLLV